MNNKELARLEEALSWSDGNSVPVPAAQLSELISAYKATREDDGEVEADRSDPRCISLRCYNYVDRAGDYCPDCEKK